ncbi:calcium and integrin-binding protein 1 [Austrofundulus limnaeus]|uniref:Calcium and integrin-binding protein 1 n=1 Tax=Austrofundulus limnaeus TaxID=52670 RepID=A0A2I4AZP5_AUSLI|nr:PREDICTED: calcium and integrin-binding protein 1 [Austrofundulus limnaeus]
MGTTSSQLNKNDLSEYQELTFLTKQEILLAHKRFTELQSKEQKGVLHLRVPMEKIHSLPELKSNPFRKRICQVFSTSEDKDGSLTFEDFLDLLSAFSDSATIEIKSHYAFRIFDFDDDGTLGYGDLEKLVNCLTIPEDKQKDTEETGLTREEMKQLITNILDESDIDKDGTVNLSEFQHVISRSPDFVSSFKIVL